MTEVAKEAFASRNYRLALEMYERCLKRQQQPNVELLLGYGDSLARCGRLREAIDVYSRCLALGGVPSDRLRHLSNALLEELGLHTHQTSSNDDDEGKQTKPQEHLQDEGKLLSQATTRSFACGVCEAALYQPVSLGCGHTFCRPCCARLEKCRACGQRRDEHTQHQGLETNVLVQRLVEKWWPREAEANAARHEADALVQKGLLNQALDGYNLAVTLAPSNPLHLSNRAHALLLLNRPQASLADADHAVRMRPDWGKGHYQRGLALSQLLRNEEALLALCTSAVLDKNPQAIRSELTRVLHRVLSSNARRQNSASFRTPYDLVEVRMRRNRHHMLLPLMNSGHHRHRHASTVTNNSLNTSDCEDNSSGGEEEISQSICRRLLSSTTPQDNSKLYATLDRLYQEVEKLKRVETKPAEILLPPRNGGSASGDLDCILCCRLLWRPVTTPCGHTYCWMCLDRCLDYSSACPLCVTSLADYLASSQRTVTDLLERALKWVAPKEYAARAATHRHEQLVQYEALGTCLTTTTTATANFAVNCASSSDSCANVAVFVCTTAFPCVACPLFVYEPRYRLMVRRCLESGVRQFGIAPCLNREATGAKRYAEYGTMLEIRDRVLLKDGCSILSTVGARRFRVLSGGERDGYDTAQVEFLKDTPITDDQLLNVAELHNKVRAKSRRWWTTVPWSQRSEIRRVFGEMPEPEENWQHLSDGPSWTWWLLAILPLGPQLQVGILGTTSLEKRLRAIEKTLDHMEQRQLMNTLTPTSSAHNSTGSMCRSNSSGLVSSNGGLPNLPNLPRLPQPQTQHNNSIPSQQDQQQTTQTLQTT